MIVPASKSPLPSRFTTVSKENVLVGAKPPIFVTTVAPCVPLTSPAKAPVKFVALTAVKAVSALVADRALTAESALVADVALPAKFPVIVPAAKSPFAFRRTIVPPVLSSVALLPSVTLPLAPLTVIPPPPARLSTPVFMSVIPLPRLTTPPPPSPAPAVTVSVASASFELSTAPAAMLPACTAFAERCVLPTAPGAIFAAETDPSATSPATTAYATEAIRRSGESICEPSVPLSNHTRSRTSGWAKTAALIGLMLRGAAVSPSSTE